MSDFVKNTLDEIESRLNKIESGGVNCIPSHFTRFINDFPGIQQKKYYLITAATKMSKTQFGSNVFIYNSLDFAMNNPESVRVRIFYCNLEEDIDTIIQRYISYLLYTLNRIRISVEDLNSTSTALDRSILELIKTEEYVKRLNYFNEHVTFIDASNPTGINQVVKEYYNNNGRTIYEPIIDPHIGKPIKDELGREIKKFVRYEPVDPDEYVILFVDHIGLISTENGLDLRNSISKLSAKYLVSLRNRYKCIPVVLQQQSVETENIEAIRNNMMWPSIAGLADCKYTAKDDNLCLGLYSPFKFQREYEHQYDINKFQDNIRFVKVLNNRGGVQGGISPLFFDGACCYFSELPRPDDHNKIERWYEYLEKIRGHQNKNKSFFIFKNKQNGKNCSYLR